MIVGVGQVETVGGGEAAAGGGAVEERAHQSDPGLVGACLAGDEGAWEELVERYQRLVYAIPRRMGLSEADADDVFQNVFVTLYRRLGDLRDRTRLSSWLITTTRRECWRLGQRGGREAGLEQAELVPAGGLGPGDEVAGAERDHLVRQALRRLDGRCRELLTALFLVPATPAYGALAVQLGMPVGSIGPTRARCFKKLEAILQSMGIEGDD